MAFGNPVAGVRPRVAVLLATYNGAQWIDEQLMSILEQQDVDVEVFIGDDRSKDGTVERIAADYLSDPRVHLTVWPQSSGSAGANFRKLFRQVPSEGHAYIALADQDDVWHPNKLRSAIEAIKREGAAGYSCAVQSFWEDGREKTLRQNPNIRGADYLFEGAGQGCTFVMTSELYNKVQRFCRENETVVETLHYHDWLIYLMVRVSGLQWYFDPHPWLRYRQHGGNEIGSRGGGLRSISRRLDMIRNGWYRGQLKAALQVSALIRPPAGPVATFSRYFGADDSARRRISLLLFFLQHGRRRLVDRVILALSATMGWV